MAVEWFQPTSGRLTGMLGLVLVAVVMVIVLADGWKPYDISVLAGLALVALVIWVAILRPRVGLDQTSLLLRNMVSTTVVPLAAIEEVALRQVLAVRTASGRHLGAGVGRTRRSIARTDRGAAPDPVQHYPDFVEQRIRARIEDARAVSGVQPHSPEQAQLASGVRRDWSWPEIAALVVLSLVLLITRVL